MNNIYLNLAKKLSIITIVCLIFSLILVQISPIFAADPLRFSNIRIARNDENATISWQTNASSVGIVEYGTHKGIYSGVKTSGQTQTNHTVVIGNLASDTQYFVLITAYSETEEVKSSEITFTTSVSNDETAPILSGVEVLITNGSTATIQWKTNEPATTEIEYGLTESYGQVKKDGSYGTIHD